MSSESNNSVTNRNHQGFFARIIRDALCTLPDVDGERQTITLEQQLQKVGEHSESAARVNSQSNTRAQTPEHTAEASAHTPVSQDVALQDSPPSASTARKIINAGVQPSPKDDQHSVAAPVSETAAVQPTDKNSTHFPRNTRAMAAQQPLKKIPLAITPRAPHATKIPDQPRATTTVREKSNQISVPTVITPTPAVDVFPAAVDNSLELTRVAPATPDAKRPTSPSASPPVIAESAPLPAGHRVIERKALPPELRIGAVTLRVLDVAPEQAAPKAGQPVKSTAFADSIANAESRHFLRTL